MSQVMHPPAPAAIFTEDIDPSHTVLVFTDAQPLHRGGVRNPGQRSDCEGLYQTHVSGGLMTQTRANPEPREGQRTIGDSDRVGREVIEMDTNWIAGYREEARVLRGSIEKSMTVELEAQKTVTEKTGKKAKLQTISKAALQDIAALLDETARILAEHGKPATVAGAGVIDRMTDDFATTSHDLRALATGTLRAKTPEEATADAAAFEKAAADLETAQAAMAAQERNRSRLA